MTGSYAVVDLGDLDWDDRSFAVRSFVPSGRLEDSLQHYGFLYPPWVLAKGGSEAAAVIDGGSDTTGAFLCDVNSKYIIVDGFKRLLRAKDLGLSKADCLVFPAETDRAQLLLRRIEVKLFGLPLNTAEKAQMLALMAEAIPHEKIMAGLLPALSIPARPDAIERWRRLASSGERLLEAAASDEICERAALELAAGGEDSRDAQVTLLKELRCSASIQMEILDRISEIALMHGRPKVEILSYPEIERIFDDPDKNHRQKTQALRDALGRLRFPRLRSREARFARDVDKAALPKALRLAPPPGFEGESWQLQVTFSSPEELLRLLEIAKTFAESPQLPGLMNPGVVKENDEAKS